LNNNKTVLKCNFRHGIRITPIRLKLEAMKTINLITLHIPMKNAFGIATEISWLEKVAKLFNKFIPILSYNISGDCSKIWIIVESQNRDQLIKKMQQIPFLKFFNPHLEALKTSDIPLEQMYFSMN